MPDAAEGGQAGLRRRGRQALALPLFVGLELLVDAKNLLVVWVPGIVGFDSDAAEGDGNGGALEGALALLDEMRRYCAPGACRHRSLTEHFGQHYEPPNDNDCGACDVCLGETEGLVEATDQGETPGDAMLRLTQAGRDELQALLGASVRLPSNDFNKLIVALKLKFLDALDPAERAEQADALVEMREAELARLTDLRAAHDGDDGHFARWLDHDIVQIEADLAWFRQLREELRVD